MRNVVLVRQPPSKGAQAVAAALGIRRIGPNDIGRQLRKRRLPTFINWGCTKWWWNGPPEEILAGVLNHVDAVKGAVNKLRTLELLTREGVPTLKFSRNIAELDRRGIVLSRATLTGSGGDGITVIRPNDPVPPAPLYTQYEKKNAEYRVHVVRDRNSRHPDGTEEFWAWVHQKKKENGFEQSADQKLIRSYENGWVFCNATNLTEEEENQVEILGRDAVRALDLDFGAVDIIRSIGRGFLVCEVNTKPGILAGSTTDFYANAFRELLG